MHKPLENGLQEVRGHFQSTAAEQGNPGMPKAPVEGDVFTLPPLPSRLHVHVFIVQLKPYFASEGGWNKMRLRYKNMSE